MKSLTIALIVEEAAGIRLLHMLAKGPHRISNVFCLNNREGLLSTSTWDVANKLQLPVQSAQELKTQQIAEKLFENKVDLLISFRSPVIIPDPIINAPTMGAFNLHTGPLPDYAGRNVINWAIYNGEAKHGVTLHQLTSVIDGGAIVFEDSFPISPTDTGIQLTLKSIRSGLGLIDKLLEAAANNDHAVLSGRPQTGIRQYYDRQPPHTGDLNWDQLTTKIYNLIRACNYYPFPSPWGTPTGVINGKRFSLLEARISERNDIQKPGTMGNITENGIEVAVQDGWLEIIQIIVDGESIEASSIMDG